jgi:hypothetical protein
LDLVQELAAQVIAAEPDLPGPELLPARLARACAMVLPVDGAGLSLYFAEDRRLPLGASDPDSATAERLQFTVGEGPCLTAYTTNEVVVADAQQLEASWPAFSDVLVAHTPIRGVIALPLHGALEGMGALDLYVRPPGDIRAVGLADVLTVVSAVTETFTTAMAAEPRTDSGPPWLDAPLAGRRALVWQAVGMVNVGLELTSPDSLALLRAYAYAHDAVLDDVAEDVVRRRVPVADLALSTDTAR